MAQPMKLSILIGADASGAKAGGAEAKRALDEVAEAGRRAADSLEDVTAAGQRVGAAIDDNAASAIDAASASGRRAAVSLDAVGTAGRRAGASVTTAANDAGAAINQLIARTAGLNQALGAAGRGDDIAAYGAQMDALRARYNPMFAVITRYKSEVEGIRAAHRVGAISTEEMSAAISRERVATLASIDAIKGRNLAIRSMQTNNNNLQGFQTANIAAQFQDIGVTAAMGMNPLQIALQQGTQLSMVFAEMQNPIRGVGAALMSLASPVSLITIGLVALTAAGIQYFSSVPEEASAASAALDDHEAFIRRLRDAYGDAVVGLRDYSSESRKLLEQETKDRIALYKGVLNSAAADATGDLLGLPADAFEGKTKIIGDIDSAIQRLQDGVKSGRPDLRAFVESLVDIENHPGTPAAIKEIAKELRENAKEGLEAQSKLEPLIGIFNGVGASASQQVARVNALNEALKNLAQFGLPQLSEAEKLRKELDAALAGPAGATEAGVNQLEEAYRKARERIANQNPLVTNSNGMSVPVPVPTTRPSDLDFDPNEEATRKLNALLEENKQKLEQQRDALRDYLTTQNDSVARLQLEISLVGASVETRTRAIAAFEAEQKIRELGILAMGREADAIRATAQERAGLQLQLERQQAAYQATQQAGSTMIDQLTVGTGTLKDRLKSMAETALTTFQQLAVANPLKNQLLGTNLPTLTDLFSGKSASPLGATTTGTMTVTAATVMINGAPIGTGALDATRLLNPANQNIVNSPVAASASASGVEAYIRQSATARGIDPNVAVRVAQSEGGLQSWNAQSQVFKNGIQEPSYGPYQLYMGGGLGNRFQSQTGLDPSQAVNGPAGVDFALDTAKQEGWGAWYGARKAGISNWQGINPGTATTATTSTASTQAISENLSKLSTSSAVASSSVTSMATGAQTATAGLGDFSSGIGGFFQKLVSGAFADGAAFSGGSVIPFAAGGVVSRPTFFPMSGGRAGLMGEAGPEAIMPLERGAGGRLGVRASIPRGARQGGELRLRYETSNTLNIFGTSDQELLAQANAGMAMQLAESERRMRETMPQMIEDYRGNPWARNYG